MAQVQPVVGQVYSQFQGLIESEERIIAALHESYRTGLSQPKATANNEWRLGWHKNLTSRSWERDRTAVALCTRYLEKARENATRGEIDASCRLFGEARVWSEHSDLSLEGRLLCKLELAAAEAYLDYYCGDYDQAKKRLMESMEADQRLEEEFGHRLLHVHRIHLVNNMVKLEARAGNLREAMDLAADVFLYVQKKTGSMPVAGNWGAAYLQHVPIEALQFLSAQLSGELAAALAGVPSASARGALEVLLERVDIEEQHASWYPEIGSWLQLKALSIREGQLLAYLNRCIPYFSRGRGKAPLLWYLTALDAITACEGYQSAGARLFRQQVIGDLMQITHFPRHIRAVVGQRQAELDKMNAAAIA